MSAAAQTGQLEDARANGTRLFSAAFEACTEGLAIVENGQVIYANPAFLRLTHQLDSEGRALPEGSPGHESGEAPENRNGNGSNFQFKAPENEERASTLTLIDVGASCAGFRAEGADFQVLGIHDISKQRRLEEELEQTQRLATLGRLAGGIAHDFNNLLTAIMLYSDLLSAGLAHAGRLRHHAQEIRIAGEHGAALVRQLLAVVRPRDEEPGTLSLNEVVSGMHGILKRLIGENIELTFSFASGLSHVHGDPARMQQIILNLVLNARDAMPEGGLLKLETRDCERPLPITGTRSIPCVELSVCDTGCGMDGETKSRLFEPFFTTKRPGCGSGLGLATAENIVKQAGGLIEVESQVGRGTRIAVVLPRASQSLSIAETKE